MLKRGRPQAGVSLTTYTIRLLRSLTFIKAIGLLSLDGLLMWSVRKQSKLNVQS